MCVWLQLGETTECLELEIFARRNSHLYMYAYLGHSTLFTQSSFYQARAESARAFTGRRNSHSGRGEDFLSPQPNFFTETAVTPEQKVEKSFPRWEINRHAEG